MILVGMPDSPYVRRVAISLKRMGIPDIQRVYHTEDLAPGKSIIFAAARRP